MIRLATLILCAAIPAAHATERQILGEEGDWFVTIARGTDGVYFCEAATLTRSATLRVTVDSSGWYGFDVYLENAESSAAVWDFRLNVGAREWILSDATAVNDTTRGDTMVSFSFGFDPAQREFLRDLARAGRIEVSDRFGNLFETFSGAGSAAALSGLDGCRCVLMGEC